MKIAAITDIGSCRQENQDNYCAQQLAGGTAWGLVCDGMGGHAGGDVASSIVIGRLSQLDSETPANDIVAALEKASKLLSEACCARCIWAGCFCSRMWRMG